MRNPTSPDGGPPPGMTDPLTPHDVAVLFNVDTRTVARWAKAGRLTPRCTPGGHRRYAWAEVRALLFGVTQGTPQPGPMRPRRVPGRPLASASIQTGDGFKFDLDLTPVPAGRDAATPPGQVGLVLGWTTGGKAVTLTIRELRWLDDLEFAIQKARAEGVVEAGMTGAALS